MTDRILLTCNFLLAVALIGTTVLYHNRTTPMSVVFDYCNNSRISDMTSEETCGDLQDFYRVEFLCQENNTKIGTKCWVEKI